MPWINAVLSEEYQLAINTCRNVSDVTKDRDNHVEGGHDACEDRDVEKMDTHL